jgi:hypothetical protein
VVTWALGTATGVLLGLFGVELVSSRFSTAGVSPLSRPEVLRALHAARSLPAANEVALPPSSATTAPASPPLDADPARPSAGSTSSPAPAPPASTLPRPGATAGFTEAAVPTAPSSTTSTAPPEESSTTTTAAPPPTDPKGDTKSDSKGDKSNRSSTSTTTTTPKKATTTTTPPAQSPRPAQSPQPSAETRTISSAGGVVAVRYSGGKVELKWARPNAGYQVYVRSNGPDQVIVYFYTRNRVSQVVAYYNGTTPAADVQEYSGSGQGGNH